MARPGPQPKTTKHGHGGAGWTDVPNAPYTGPGSDRDLPAIPSMGWFPQVEGWWEVVRAMPHCVLWEASDWLFAIETAMMKNHYMGEFFGGVIHATMATEIRRREDQMGTTMEARRKLGIRYVDPDQVATAPAAPEVAPGGDEAEHRVVHADWIRDDGSCAACGDKVRPIAAARSRRDRLTG